MNDAYYFGCYRESGHYLFVPGPRKAWDIPNDFPLSRYEILDGGLLPHNLPEIEGLATFVNINGWTIISFWDRSVDKRGKCNSSFVLRGLFD